MATRGSHAGFLGFPQEHDIPTIVFPKNAKTGEGLTTEELLGSLTDVHQVDLIILAGYLKLVPQEVVRAFNQRIVNIHPALLPAFGGKGLYGMNVHRAVVSSGARYSGATPLPPSTALCPTPSPH